jgi:glycosyltransferase involved in cell wall biosynthesis
MVAEKIHAGAMNILILSTKLPYPPKDGGAIATLNLAAGLSDAGYHVSMLAFNTSKHYTDPDNIPAALRKKILFYTVDKNTSVRPLKALFNLFFSKKPYIAERYNDRHFAEKLKDLTVSGNFDVVQLEGPYLAHYIPVIRHHSTARISLRAHNVEHRIWEKRSEHAPGILRKRYFRLLAKRIRRLEEKTIHNIDALVPISEPDATILKRQSALPSITIPAGLDLQDYATVTPMPGSHICFIGALDWAPNQEGLAWFTDLVLPHLLDRRPETAFHVAGRNAPQGIIRLLSHPSVTYHGEVEDARAYMQDFGILAVPLLTGSGIRIKILEGMAMGMCVVTTSTGAAGLTAQHGRHLFVEDDPSAFAGRLIQLLEDPPGRIAIGKAAREMVQENFDTFAIASRLGAFYNKLA